ncbi:MAG: hypothetical protein N2109_07155 [Fimbriimonadales bacterium]|nr:hypothetical protein [Fimbriimonadales bacterium]
MNQHLSLPLDDPTTGPIPPGDIEPLCAEIERRARDIARCVELIADVDPSEMRAVLAASGWLRLAAGHLSEASERLTALGLRAARRVVAAQQAGEGH